MTGYWRDKLALTEPRMAEILAVLKSHSEAGSLLRELWSLGQQPTADELLKEVSGSEIEMSAVGDRVRERL